MLHGFSLPRPAGMIRATVGFGVTVKIDIDVASQPNSMRRLTIHLESDANYESSPDSDSDIDSERGCPVVSSASCHFDETPEPVRGTRPKAGVTVCNDS